MAEPARPATQAAPKSFAALRNRDYSVYLTGNMLAMMADSIEHTITYWVIWEKFHSPFLGGFAILVHWLPFLLFSIWSGALADRHDPRRIVQIGMGLFMVASLAWGYFFLTDTLEMWIAMVILTVHGFAGVFWAPASQLLIHDIVGGPQLQSGVRLMATSRVLGLLAGPTVGGLLLGTLGAINGIFLNALIYLPLTLWLVRAPYGPKFRTGAEAHATRVAARPQTWRDILTTIRETATNRTILCMTLLAGGFSFFVGNSYQAQMPGFAQDLGHGDSSFFYSILMAATAAGALTAGLVLESGGFLKARPRTAFFLVMTWCVAITIFAISTNYWMALGVLFAVGFLDLSFNSMAQTLVQLEAPAHLRGRVIGLYNTSSAGMRAFAGITVGWGGELVGIHWSLAVSASVLLAGTVLLFSFLMRAAHVEVRASPGE